MYSGIRYGALIGALATYFAAWYVAEWLTDGRTPHRALPLMITLGLLLVAASWELRSRTRFTPWLTGDSGSPVVWFRGPPARQAGRVLVGGYRC